MSRQCRVGQVAGAKGLVPLAIGVLILARRPYIQSSFAGRFFVQRNETFIGLVVLLRTQQGLPRSATFTASAFASFSRRRLRELLGLQFAARALALGGGRLGF